MKRPQVSEQKVTALEKDPLVVEMYLDGRRTEVGQMGGDGLYESAGRAAGWRGRAVRMSRSVWNTVLEDIPPDKCTRTL